jgi:hypothetical protein
MFCLLLMGSLFWVGLAFATPMVREKPVTLVNYQHEGVFDYTIYVKPSYLFGPPLPEATKGQATKTLYFTSVIKDIQVEFAYEFVAYSAMTQVSSEANIVGIVTGPSGWKKEFPLSSISGAGTSLSISFPLKLDEFDKAINIIEDELGIRPKAVEYEYTEEGEPVEMPATPEPNAYDLVIEARVDIKANTGAEWIKDSFVQPIDLKIDKGTLSWATNLNLSEKRFGDGGVSYEHRGNFGYTIGLKPNSLYPADVTTLSPEPYVKPPVVSRPAGESYFLKTIDLIEADFGYRFVCDKLVTNLTEEVQVTAVLNNPDEWTKTFTLVPKTDKSGDFTLSFPVDVVYFNDLANTIGQETGVPERTLELTIEAKVHTQVDTEDGHIDEVYTHTLEGTLEGSTLTWNEELQKSVPGTIKGTKTLTDPNVGKYRVLSVAMLVVIFLGFLFVVRNASQVRAPALEEEAQRARKKYKGVISDVVELPAVRAGETVITFNSLDELATAADAMLKPVLHLAETDKHTYCVIDGLIRYEYVSELEPSDNVTDLRTTAKKLIDEELREAKDKGTQAEDERPQA